MKPLPKCPVHNREVVYYDGCLGYESFVCPVCHWDINDPIECRKEEDSEKAKVFLDNTEKNDNFG